MAVFHDDNVNIHQAQIVKECLGGVWRIIFTHGSAPLSPVLEIIESLWGVLEETLQSAGLLHWKYKKTWPKTDAPLDGNKCCDASRGASIFGQELALTKLESSRVRTVAKHITSTALMTQS